MIIKTKVTEGTKLIKTTTEIQSIETSKQMNVIKTVLSLKKMPSRIGTMRKIDIVIRERQMRKIMKLEITLRRKSRRSQVTLITTDTLRIQITIRTDGLS